MARTYMAKEAVSDARIVQECGLGWRTKERAMMVLRPAMFEPATGRSGDDVMAVGGALVGSDVEGRRSRRLGAWDAV